MNVKCKWPRFFQMHIDFITNLVVKRMWAPMIWFLQKYWFLKNVCVNYKLIPNFLTFWRQTARIILVILTIFFLFNELKWSSKCYHTWHLLRKIILKWYYQIIIIPRGYIGITMSVSLSVFRHNFVRACSNKMVHGFFWNTVHLLLTI